MNNSQKSAVSKTLKVESAINEKSIEENLNSVAQGDEDAKRGSIIDDIEKSPIKPSEDQTSHEHQSGVDARDQNQIMNSTGNKDSLPLRELN